MSGETLAGTLAGLERKISVLDIAGGIKSEIHQRYEDKEGSIKEKLSAGQLSLDEFRQTLREAREEFALELPRQDPLTGLPERPLMYLTAWEMNNEGVEIGGAYFDMFGLKDFNTNFGHDGGDLALLAIGTVLEKVAKNCQGLCVRYGFGGGDDFAIIFANKKRGDLLAVCREVRALLLKETTLENLGQGVVCGELVTTKKYGEDVPLSLSQETIQKIETKKPGLLGLIIPISCGSAIFNLKPDPSLDRKGFYNLVEEQMRKADRKARLAKIIGCRSLKDQSGSQYLARKIT